VLTEHIPLPDPARGNIKVGIRVRRYCSAIDLYQDAFSNHLVIYTLHENCALAHKLADELNQRMAVARALGC
jgi:hypothetical protein